jgi:hypothetical protein
MNARSYFIYVLSDNGTPFYVGYTMAQKAEIPAFKVRGQWRFKRQDIDLWIEQQKSTQRDDTGR